MNAPTPVKKLVGRFLPAPQDTQGDTALALFDRTQTPVTMSMQTYRWVLLVCALVALYFLGLASDRFTAETHIFVKSSQAAPPAVQAVPIIGGATPQLQDVLLARDFIESQDMLTLLDEKLALRAHYSAAEWDFFSRLSADASEEDFLDYYREHVQLTLDDTAATLTIKAQAFTKDFALALAQEVLAQVEAFVNRVGQEIARDEIAFVSSELERAKTQLTESRQKLLAFQNANNVLNPEATGEAMQLMVNGLRERIINIETELASLSAFLNADAAEVVSKREQLRALRDQLVKEEAKLAGSESATLNDIAIEFQQLQLEVDYATSLYRGALNSLEQVRVDANRKLKHLVVIQSPRTPQSAEYPRRLYNIATVFVLLSIAYGVGIMIWATVQEHRDV